MKKIIFIFIVTLIAIKGFSNNHTTGKNLHFFPSSNKSFQYTGRIDFSNANPRFWQPGVYFTANFKGSNCYVILNDEMLYGKDHNYIEVVVDGAAKRLRLQQKTDTILAANDLPEGKHSLLVCKNTEANIGYIEFVGLLCEDVLSSTPKPTRKIECFGNSITCGTGSDQSVIKCGQGEWQDQHNAYMSYGAVTARNLNAQWQLSAVSGIGMIHSCCNLEILMPQVFDKISMRDDSIKWNFKNYIPDVATICLGQNDGKQDSVKFCSAYVNFIDTLRSLYPNAPIICLSSPMADSSLNAVLHNYLSGIVEYENEKGDKKVSKYFFSKRYYHGCDTHPDLEEHSQMAAELSAYIKQLMNW